MPAKPQLAVGLDVGSSRTRCVVLLLERGHVRCLSYGLAISSGWTRDRISSQDAVAESMRAALADAEHGAGVPIESATLGVGGSIIQSWSNTGQYEFGRPREITADDLAYAVEAAADIRLERDRMILHVLPQDFILDGRAGFRKPMHAMCSRLEANVQIITTSIQEHQALINAAHQAHLMVEETVFEALASAYACATPDDRARGVAVIDLGQHSTGMVIYDGERLMYAGNLPVTSDHLTRDIAYMFRIAYEDAEALKQQYGCAILGLTAESTLIEVPSNEDRPPREAHRRELIKILEGRAAELFHFAQGEVEKAGMHRSLLEGVLLTGGGALLAGMWDMAERRLDCHACNGHAKGIADWPREMNSPVWATAAGLAMYSAKLKIHQPFRGPGGLMSLVMR